MSRYEGFADTNEDFSNGRNAKTKGHIFRKFVKQLLPNKFAKGNKKMTGFIEIYLQKKQTDGETPKTIPTEEN